MTFNDDNSLLDRAEKGNQRACRQLFDRHADNLHGLALRMTQDRELACDVVQDAFIKAFRKLPDFDRRSEFATWIHRITVNTALDALRKRQRDRTVATAEPQEYVSPNALSDDLDPASRLGIQRETARGLSCLTDLERSALVLRHFEGRSIAEIATDLDISVNACKQAIFRAVKKMRVVLEPYAEMT